jgi:succinoglycan biosynthesis transport protein ExoP
MNPTQLFGILWARRKLLLITTLLVLSVAVITKLAMPATYIATTSLVIDSKGIDPLTGANVPTQSSAATLATQSDVIASRIVALKVVDVLGLVENSLEGEPRTREGWAYALLQELTVKPAANSNVVRIRFEDPDPVFAAKVVNAFAAAYLQTNLELRLEPARRQSAWFDEQLQGMRGKLESSRQNLSDYQLKNGIIAAEERLDVENAKLEEISRQLVVAQRDSQEASVRMRQASGADEGDRLTESPDIMSNGLLQTMKGQLVQAEGRLATLSERLDRNHPQYMSAAAEVRTLREKINAEMQRTKGSIGQSAQIASQQVASLQHAFDEQKTRILALKRERDELAVRASEVDNEQGAYDKALQRASQLRLESQLDQNSIAILDQALPPGGPAGLRLPVTIVLALVFGALLGAGIALLLEMLDRRVRSGAELLQLSGLEVLGEVPHLRANFRPTRTRLLHGRKAVLEIRPA